jgi:hypothetical protein
MHRTYREDREVPTKQQTSKQVSTYANVAALTVDQKLVVLSDVACGDATTSRQPKQDAEPKTGDSA